MFENLKDFKYIRSGKQAFGFYLAYNFLCFVILTVICALAETLGLLGDTKDLAYANGQKLVWVLGPVYCMVMAYLVAYKKGLGVKPIILMAASAGILSLLSVFAGMIAPAYLTTTAYRNRS